MKKLISGGSSRTTRIPESPATGIFLGMLDPHVLERFPSMPPDQREVLAAITRSIRGELTKRDVFDPVRADQDAMLPESVIAKMKDLGLTGLIVPEEFGGMGLSVLQWLEVIACVTSIDHSLAVTLGAHQGIGYKALLLAGTEEQKRKWLPKLASGEMMAAYCLTEAGAGSDVQAMRSRAVLEGDHYVLIGEKIFISNGGLADFFTVFAKAVGADGKEHITCFIVTKDMPGVSVGPHEEKMGIRASSTTSVRFDNVRIPKENVIEDRVSGLYGMRLVMEILNGGRLTLGAGSMGRQRWIVQEAEKAAAERTQFGRHIAEFPLIQEKIARMRAGLYALESMIYLTGGLIDSGALKRYPIEAAICKVFGTELAWRSIDELLQIQGGMGYMRHRGTERILRDLRIGTIFEGTTEINLLQIAGKGLLEAGKQLAQHMRRMASGETTETSKPTLGPMPEAIDRLARRFEELSGEFAQAIQQMLPRHMAVLTDDSQQHTLQLTLQAVARVSIDLYAMLAILIRTRDTIQDVEGVGRSDTVEGRVTLTRYFFADVEARIRENLRIIRDGDNAALTAAAARAQVF